MCAMSSETSGLPPGPGGTAAGKRSAVALQVKLACATLDAVRSRYPELRERRFRLRARQAWPIETQVRLEAKLSTGAPCFHALALVERVTGGGAEPVLLTLAIVAMDDSGRELVAWMGGTPPRPIPVAKPAAPAPPPSAPPAPRAPPPAPARPAAVAMPAPAAARSAPPAAPGRRASAPPPPVPDFALPSVQAEAPLPPIEWESLFPAASRTSATPRVSWDGEDAAPAVAEAPRARRGPPPPPTEALSEPVQARPKAAERAKAARPAPAGRVIGIDLGTSRCAAAVVDGGKPILISSPDPEGSAAVPSLVALDETGGIVVGEPARVQMLAAPRNAVHGFKRLVGRQFRSPVVTDLIVRSPWEIAQGLRGEASVKLGEKIYSLQKITSLLLAEMKAMAERRLGEPVSRAVITVPAWYNDNQRQAVRAAGALAGLEVERIVSEPLAAAVAFARGRKGDQRVLVYDLGGGKFDAAVVQIRGGACQVLAAGGDTFLGGLDFDKALVDEVLSRFEMQHGAKFSGDAAALQRLQDAAERAKIALSDRDSARIHVPFVSTVDQQRGEIDETVSREDLEKLTAGLVDRTLRICEQVLAGAGLHPADVNEVLLAGGQGRMPLVQRKVRELFGKEPSKAADAGQSVALGAALVAHAIHSGEGGAAPADVLSMSIGVGMPGGGFEKVLQRNTPLPQEKTHPWTSQGRERTLEIPIFQGESDKALENEYLGTLAVSGVPRAKKKGKPAVDLVFSVNAESILAVSAKEHGTSRPLAASFSTQDTPETVRRRLANAPPPGRPVYEQVGLDEGNGIFGWLKRKRR